MGSKHKKRKKRGGQGSGKANRSREPKRANTGNSAPVQAQSLLELLVSPAAQDRESSCVTIARVFASQGSLDLIGPLLQGGALKKLKARLCDESAAVRLSACFALFNFSKCCSSPMYRQVQLAEIPKAVFTYVEWLLRKDSSCAESANGEAVVVALDLLTNLYERLETTIALEDTENLEILFSCIDHQQPSVRRAAAALMHLCTEDNPSVAKKMWDNPASIQRLVALLARDESSRATELVHFCGVLNNISHGRNPSERERLLGLIIPFLKSKVRVENCFEAPERSSEVRFNCRGSALQVQLLVLEVLTNTVTEFGDSPCAVAALLAERFDVPLLSFVKNGSLVLSKADLTENPREDVAALCERAFGALDNLVQILPVEELARLDMAGLWSVTAKILFEFFTRASEAEYGVLESLTALLWSFLRKYEEAGKLATISGVVSEQNLEQFVYLARSEITPVVRANSVGSLGVVFRIADDKMLRTICRAVHSALTDTSLLVVVQAVETIFLIYGDSTHDDLYALFKVEGILKSVLPRLKSKENDSLTSLTLDADVLSNVIVNLVAFLNYKQGS